MRRKIHKQLLAIAALAVSLTLILSTIVYYNLFQNEIIDDLKSYVNTLKGTEIFQTGDYSTFQIKNSNVRITLVREDGTVLYDTEAPVEKMSNHKDRPEIEEALAEGEGSSVRESETLAKSAYYYAIKLENGTILRVGKETSSIFSIFSHVMPSILGIALLMMALCAILAHFVTKTIIRPIEQMALDLEEEEPVEIYKELIPFVNTIKKQHEDILKSARMRQDFTANVSHELKTPLTAISGYSELIENGMANGPDVQRFAKEIHHNSNRLLTLINDTIRLSELDVVQQEEEFEPVDLYEVCVNCVEMFQINASQHHVTISFEGVPCTVCANKQMMEEVIYNLCDNAIRYNNENGLVFVSLQKVHSDVILIVKDTGIGISTKHQKRIFERFYRVDKSRSKKSGGTGLGLAIVKHILTRHDAEMNLDSVPGKGTTIQIIFHEKKQEG